MVTITFFWSSSVLVMFVLCLFACYSYFVLHLLDTSFKNQLAFFSHSSCVTPLAIALHVVSCATLFALLLSCCSSCSSFLTLPFLTLSFFTRCHFFHIAIPCMLLLFSHCYSYHVVVPHVIPLTLHLLHVIPFTPFYHATTFTSFLLCCSFCDAPLVM